MSIPLFFFSHLDALDTVPLSWIKATEIVEDKIVFRIVDNDGNPIEKRRPITRFVAIQISEWGIEVYGDTTKLNEIARS